MDNINILYNIYVQYLLKTLLKIFDKLYQIVKNKIDKLIDKTKENMKRINESKQYKILNKFIITDNTNILYSS